MGPTTQEVGTEGSLLVFSRELLLELGIAEYDVQCWSHRSVFFFVFLHLLFCWGSSLWMYVVITVHATRHRYSMLVSVRACLCVCVCVCVCVFVARTTSAVASSVKGNKTRNLQVTPTKAPATKPRAHAVSHGQNQMGECGSGHFWSGTRRDSNKLKKLKNNLINLRRTRGQNLVGGLGRGSVLSSDGRCRNCDRQRTKKESKALYEWE